MSQAFVLTNCESGAEIQVVSDLKAIDGVKKVYWIFGIYYIVVNLECGKFEELRQTIVLRINNECSTKTLIGIDGSVR
ncbi:MAG: Lrp/AsnC family transcriptional regulator [Nitrosopumilus sp.]|nr:Lrp/AsnC family transcriptional regulator [Nitrosopumilus sp.]